jgi:7-cyano-7-deazaguanine reductase
VISVVEKRGGDMVKKEFDTKGYKDKQDKIRTIKIKYPIKVVANKYSDRAYIVKLKSDELITLCPKTGLPDFGKLILIYKPSKYLLEQKSFKLYLTCYKDLKIFQEFATNKIFEDFLNKVKPVWAKIIVIWKKRGGIRTKVVIENKPEY